MASVICVGCMLVVWQSVVCGECDLCWVHACSVAELCVASVICVGCMLVVWQSVVCGECDLCWVHACSVTECCVW